MTFMTLQYFCFHFRLWLLYNSKSWLYQILPKFLLKLSTDWLLATHVGKQFHKSAILSVNEYFRLLPFLYGPFSPSLAVPDCFFRRPWLDRIMGPFPSSVHLSSLFFLSSLPFFPPCPGASPLIQLHGLVSARLPRLPAGPDGDGLAVA